MASRKARWSAGADAGSALLMPSPARPRAPTNDALAPQLLHDVLAKPEQLGQHRVGVGAPCLPGPADFPWRLAGVVRDDGLHRQLAVPLVGYDRDRSEWAKVRAVNMSFGS